MIGRQTAETMENRRAIIDTIRAEWPIKASRLARLTGIGHTNIVQYLCAIEHNGDALIAEDEAGLDALFAGEGAKQ